MLLVLGPYILQDPLGQVHLHTNFEDSEICGREELGGHNGQQSLCQRTSRWTEGWNDNVPAGLKTNFRQFSYEQMSVLLPTCWMGS